MKTTRVEVGGREREWRDRKWKEKRARAEIISFVSPASVCYICKDLASRVEGLSYKRYEGRMGKRKKGKQRR